MIPHNNIKKPASLTSWCHSTALATVSCESSPHSARCQMVKLKEGPQHWRGSTRMKREGRKAEEEEEEEAPSPEEEEEEEDDVRWLRRKVSGEESFLRPLKVE